MGQTYNYGIISGGTGSFGSLQYTTNGAGGTKEFMKTGSAGSGPVLYNLTSVSASATIQGGAATFDSVQLNSNIIKASDGGTAITLDTSDNVTITGDLTVSGNDIDFAAGGANIGASVGANNLTLGGATSTVVVAGNLTVNGTTTTVDTDNLLVKDKLITLNDGGGAASAGGAGLEFEEGSSVTGFIKMAADRAGYEFKDSANGNTITIDMGADAKTVTVSGDLNIEADSRINQDVTTDANVTFANISGAQLSGSGNLIVDGTAQLNGNVTIKNGASLTSNNVDINGGAIDGTTIGATSQSSVKATTLSGSSTLDVDGAAQFNNSVTVKSGQTFTSDTVDINGGAIDGAIIGGSSAAAGTFTTLAATSLSASSYVSASSFEVDGRASISYDTSALDFSTGGAGAALSTTMFSASVELQGPSLEVSGAAKAGSLYLGASGSTVSVILDEDDLGSNSASALATQQSIKAYVDAQLGSQDVDFAGDTGTGAVDLDTQTLIISGTTNEIETSASGQTLTIGLPNDVTIGNDLDVTNELYVASHANINGNLGVTGSATFKGAVTLGDATADVTTVTGQLTASFGAQVNGGNLVVANTYDILPGTNLGSDLGSTTNRFGAVYANNMYTGDFHMKNERGDWTLFEESDYIRIRNNATGQEFKLNMTPIEE